MGDRPGGGGPRRSGRRRCGPVLLSCLLWAGGPAADAAADEPAAGGEIELTDAVEAEAPAPWRGSEVIYRNEVSIVGLDPSAELTWNPYWAMSWGFKPRWWFDDVWWVGARLDVSREVTEADDTTYAGETWVQDLLVSAGASRFVTIPGAGIDVSADLLLTTPTSKVSRARTLALGVGPGVRLSRTFEPLGELTIGYHVRFTSLLHRYTTAGTETPLVPGCTASESGCERFLNTGVRNVQWRVQHGVGVSWRPLEWLGVSTGFEHVVGWLYPIEADDPLVTSGVADPEDRRHSSAFDVEVTFAPLSSLEIGLGYQTVSPQLAPDSTYYNPFYNRYSLLYLDVRLIVEGLVDVLGGAG